MDLSKLLDVTDVSHSDSILSKNTSILKTTSIFEPSSSTLVSSFNKNKDNLNQLINQVTKQDLILDIINKCVEDKSNTLNPELKTKTKNIIKFNALKASINENNLMEILVIGDKSLDLSCEKNDVKLNKQESRVLNEVVQKCIDQMYAQMILEKRHSSTKSSTDRIEQLKAKIEEKFFAVESVMKSIEQIQDQMLHLTTEEYHKNVIEDNYNIAQMTLDSVEKLHCNAVLTLSATQVAESDVNVSKTQNEQPDLNESFLGLDDSINNLEFSIEATKHDIDRLEQRLAQYKDLESNPGHAAVFKTIRKLTNTIKQKRFILKKLMGSGD
ncbi:hypothetical protein M8J76_014530 [Diaphorina citri]|nr:hypothetical protein M8J75_008636 [Diaphorina citri]KAI5716911.1 hypothetical protein M8J76_014530 [Diaphorina citri]